MTTTNELEQKPCSGLSDLTAGLALPPLPPAFGLFVGARLTPPGTTEFFGYLYGTTADEKCDLFTADQMREYARLAIEAANDKLRGDQQREEL